MPKETNPPAAALQSLLDEYRLKPFSLAKAIGLSPSSTHYLCNGKTKVSVDTALRLAKFFGTTPAFWLDLRREADLKEATNDKTLQAALKNINKAQKSAATTKAPVNPRKKPTLSDKRRQAAKTPGAKPARGKQSAAKGK